MLSNPFDLAFAAELLARGRMPSPTALIAEAFRLADERYREVAKAPFPLEAFGLPKTPPTLIAIWRNSRAIKSRGRSPARSPDTTSPSPTIRPRSSPSSPAESG
jgi:hypothetical protein